MPNNESNLVICNNGEDSQSLENENNETPAEFSVQLQSVKFNNEFEDKSNKETAPNTGSSSNNLHNKTLISISYRNPTLLLPESASNKRNIMLASLAQDLEKHRNESSLSRSTSSQSSTSSNSSTSNNNGSREDFRDRLIRESMEDGDSDDDTHKGSKSLFDQSDDSSEDDSDCDSALPDMIPSCSEQDMFGEYSDSDDSKSESKSSSSSNKSKAKLLFKNVVNSNKKYTKIMKKNLSKTSKFIVNTTQQLRNDTSEMVKKLKHDKKSGGEGTACFYTDNFETNKVKSKWTIHKSSSKEEVYAVNDVVHDVKKIEKKSDKNPFEKFAKNSGHEVFSRAKNAFKFNFDTKKKSKHHEEQFSNCDRKSSVPEAPMLLQLKRLQSTEEVKPSVTTTGVTNKIKPPIPPRVSKQSSQEYLDNTANEPSPPVAPARRKRSKDLLKLPTLFDVKRNFSLNLKIIDDQLESVDELVNVLDNSTSCANVRIQRCLLKSSNTQFNLMVCFSFIFFWIRQLI